MKNTHPSVEINDNIILHLPVKSEDLNKDNEFGDNRYLKYNPVINEPEPWAPVLSSEITNFNNISTLNINNFEEISDKLDNDNLNDEDYSKYNINQGYPTNAQLNNNMDYFNNLDNNNNTNNNISNISNVNNMSNTNLNRQENNYSNNQISNLCITDIKTQDKTDIHCWWCCHGFESCPIGIPYKYQNDKFHIYGVFCSFNCACSYNFNDNNVNTFERYSLLNLLYKKVFKCSGINNKVKMAPPRQVLKKFGGYLSIEEFRKTCQNNDKTYKILMPPVISIIPQIEESNTIGNFDKSIPIDNNKIRKADLNLKLRRQKPIVNPNRTLESYMK